MQHWKSALLACILGMVAVVAQSADLTYREAYTAATENGQPMLVMVSTEWCPACQVMKRRIMPQAKLSPVFHRVVFAAVNPDTEGELSRSLIGNGPIPQLILFRREAKKWSRTVLVGSQAVETVVGMIERGTVPEIEAKK